MKRTELALLKLKARIFDNATPLTVLFAMFIVLITSALSFGEANVQGLLMPAILLFLMVLIVARGSIARTVVTVASVVAAAFAFQFTFQFSANIEPTGRLTVVWTAMMFTTALTVLCFMLFMPIQRSAITAMSLSVIIQSVVTAFVVQATQAALMPVMAVYAGVSALYALWVFWIYKGYRMPYPGRKVFTKNYLSTKQPPAGIDHGDKLVTKVAQETGLSAKRFNAGGWTSWMLYQDDYTFIVSFIDTHEFKVTDKGYVKPPVWKRGLVDSLYSYAVNCTGRKALSGVDVFPIFVIPDAACDRHYEKQWTGPANSFGAFVVTENVFVSTMRSLADIDDTSHVVFAPEMKPKMRARRDNLPGVTLWPVDSADKADNENTDGSDGNENTAGNGDKDGMVGNDDNADSVNNDDNADNGRKVIESPVPVALPPGSAVPAIEPPATRAALEAPDND